MKKKLIGIFVCMLLIGTVLTVGGQTVNISDNEKIVYEKSAESQPELSVKVRGGIGIHLVVENIGDADATEALCFIFIHGSLNGPSPNSHIYEFDTLAPGQTVRLSFRPVGFGIGLFSDLPRIEVIVDCAEGSRYDVDRNAIILFNFIKLL